MNNLRKFYLNDVLAFVYNDLSKEFGFAAADIKVLNLFPLILKRFWASTGGILPADNGPELKCMLTTELSILQNVFFFGTQYGDINCTVVVKKFSWNSCGNSLFIR